jgi:SAM-dependent methyltransferase
MASERSGNGVSAGISASEPVDVATLFAQLKEEVRGSEPSAPAGRIDRPAPSGARGQAERVWPVTFDQPVHRRGGMRGGLEHPVKRTVRRLVRWYVEPLALDQRTFNEAVLKLVDELHERVDASLRQLRAAEERINRAERAEELARELEHRLTRLERRPAGTPATVAAQPRAEALPDYFAFEARMRGAPELIRERQRPYVEDFRVHAPVLDLGCGRGEFLALLREAGIEARGVDADGDMAAFARGEGLDVEQADALAYLERLEDGSLGGLFAAQLVEHLPPAHLVRLLELGHAKLRPGGVLIAETINPLAPRALRDYFADLTHAQPLVPETLALLATGAGFSSVETRYVNEPPAAERLRAVELPADPAFDRAREALAHNVDRLNEQLFGPLDYAVVAVR